VGGKDLETAEVQIPGFVHHAHPTAADLADHAVVREGPANHGQQRGYFPALIVSRPWACGPVSRLLSMNAKNRPKKPLAEKIHMPSA